MANVGNGYRLVAADGGVFTFGTSYFRGSAATIDLVQPIVGMSGCLSERFAPVTASARSVPALICSMELPPT